MADLTVAEFTLRECRRWVCECGCRRLMPHLVGQSKWQGETYPVEFLLGHHEHERIVFAAVRGRFAFGSGVFGFVVGVSPDDSTSWTPLLPEELPAERWSGLGGVPRHPTEWGDDPYASDVVMALLGPAFDACPEYVVDHVYGQAEGADFTFRQPDPLLNLEPDERRSNLNFAQLETRRFVRALVPVPMVGGAEIRIGTWFEVEPPAYQALYDAWDQPALYMGQRLTGVARNHFELEGRQVFDARASLAPRSSSTCLFVERFDDASLERALGTEVTATESKDVVKALQHSHLKASVDRVVRARAN